MFNQNTPAWEKMRKDKIGSSDAPVIMGVSPWATPYQRWQEKLDLVRSKPMTKAMARGHDLEHPALLELERQTGLFFTPQVRFHSNISFMMASLDCVDPEGKNIAEIKCPGKTDHDKALAGVIPEKYYPQLQHQLEVCELDMIRYFSYDGTFGVIVNVFRHDSYIKNMLKKEKEFWHRVQDLDPPELTQKDYETKVDDRWETLAKEWRAVDQQIAALEKKQKDLREQIISSTDNRNTIGAGIKVSKIVRKGSIDYTAIPEIQQLDVELYRKKPVECWKIATY